MDELVRGLDKVSMRVQCRCLVCERTVNAGLGCDLLQWYVPRFRMKSIYLLKVIGKTDELRLAPVSSASEITEAAIIEALAHAQPVALVIEAEKRHENQVQAIRFYHSIVVWEGFYNAVFIEPDGVSFVPSGKPEPAGVKGM